MKYIDKIINIISKYNFESPIKQEKFDKFKEIYQKYDLILQLGQIYCTVHIIIF
jgi:hypothetical protein